MTEENNKIKYVLDNWDCFDLNFSTSTSTGKDYYNNIGDKFIEVFSKPNNKVTIPFEDVMNNKYVCLKFTHIKTREEYKFLASENLILLCQQALINNKEDIPKLVNLYLKQKLTNSILEEL